MIWLDSERGEFLDWVTQRWVCSTGVTLDLAEAGWLEGPRAGVDGVGDGYFQSLAQSKGLVLADASPNVGVMEDFHALTGPTFDAAKIDPAIARFYEQTAGYELDVWSQWSGVFRPFGRLLARLFSRRLRQLNVPLSGLDTSRGLSNEVIRLIDPATRQPRYTAWYRRLRESGQVLYAGFYSVCRLPDRVDPCVKVVFPLPNGNAIVFMHTRCLDDGSLLLTSAGDRFGEPGFYFTVHRRDERIAARYVRALRETIHVYSDQDRHLRADHVFTFWGATFLRLHYRMRPM